MRYVFLFLLGIQLLAGETFTVIHEKKAWPNGKGTIEITGEGIAFTARKQKNSRKWGWRDIQYFDRISETEFNILTYEDQKRYLGRDRSYRFRITDGKLSDALFAEISNRLGRPVTNRVVRQPERILYEIPVKHLHSFGGCEGVLQFTDKAIYYVTTHSKDARVWLLARDVNSVWSGDRYELEIHAYDNNRREFSRTRVYKFSLKRPLAPRFYRELKLKLYRLESAHLPVGSEGE